MVTEADALELVSLLIKKTLAGKVGWWEDGPARFTCVLGGARLVMEYSGVGPSMHIGRGRCAVPYELWDTVGKQVRAGQDVAVTEAIKLLRKM